MNIIIGMGWTAGNIDNFAHIGGLVSGMLMGLAFVVTHSTFTTSRFAGNEKLLKRAGIALAVVWYSVLLSVTFFK